VNAIPFWAATPPAAIVVVGVAAFLAGLARGFSGFGGALIFVPPASAVLGPVVAAPMLLLIDAVAAAPLIPNAWRRAERRPVAIMVAGALAGVPAGAFVLLHTDPVTLRWGMAVIVLAILALLLSGWRYRNRPATPLTMLVGAIAGFLNGLAQMGGTPVTAFWLGGPGQPMTVRANIILFFAISTLITAVSYARGGVLTAAILMGALAIGPFYGLGLYLGARMFSMAEERLFRRICCGLIACAGLISLPLWDRARALMLS
jgi:uncharacterized membrane protein YfcA